MTSTFFKFPSTPHLAVLPGVSIRDDKVLSKREQDSFLSHELVIEEKIDGANLGISFDSRGNVLTQNRGSYLKLPQGGQWQPLGEWIGLRSNRFYETLTDRYVLFGEWCYATHTVPYDRLPDWFLGFDVFDLHERRFVSSKIKQSLFSEMGIVPVPVLARGRFSFREVINVMQGSSFGSEPAEGLYLRRDEGEWLAQRVKIIRAGFIQAIDRHWSRQPFRANRLA